MTATATAVTAVALIGMDAALNVMGAALIEWAGARPVGTVYTLYCMNCFVNLCRVLQ